MKILLKDYSRDEFDKIAFDLNTLYHIKSPLTDPQTAEIIRQQVFVEGNKLIAQGGEKVVDLDTLLAICREPRNQAGVASGRDLTLYRDTLKYAQEALEANI